MRWILLALWKRYWGWVVLAAVIAGWYYLVSEANRQQAQKVKYAEPPEIKICSKEYGDCISNVIAKIPKNCLKPAINQLTPKGKLRCKQGYSKDLEKCGAAFQKCGRLYLNSKKFNRRHN